MMFSWQMMFFFWEGANAWNGMLKLYPPQVSGRVDTTGWFEQLFLMSCFRSNPWHWMAGDPHQKMAGCSFLRVKLSPNDLIFPNDSLVNKDSTGKSQKNNRHLKYYICSNISIATKAPWWWLFIFCPVQPETCVNDPIYIFFANSFPNTRGGKKTLHS